MPVGILSPDWGSIHITHSRLVESGRDGLMGWLMDEERKVGGASDGFRSFLVFWCRFQVQKLEAFGHKFTWRRSLHWAGMKAVIVTPSS